MVLPPTIAWTAVAAFIGCVHGQAVASVVAAMPKRAVTTCSSLHGPHCFALNERNVPSYLLHGVEFEPNAMDGHLRQAIPRIELPPTSKKLAAHGFADDVLFGGVSIQTLQREDAHNALQATAHALKEWMQRQPGYSESMLHTAIKVAAKKIDALLPPSSQPSSAAPLSTEAMTDPLQPHDHVESSVGLPVPASNDPTDSVATGDEFSEDDVLAFMLLSREEKHLLLEFDTARTRRLIKAQGRLLRGKTKSGPSGHASDTEDDNVVRTTPRLVDKALQEATDALKQRVQDLKAQQSTATDSRIDTSP